MSLLIIIPKISIIYRCSVFANVYHNKIAKGCKVNYAKQQFTLSLSPFSHSPSISFSFSHPLWVCATCALAQQFHFISCMQSYNQKCSDFVQFLFLFFFPPYHFPVVLNFTIYICRQTKRECIRCPAVSSAFPSIWNVQRRIDYLQIFQINHVRVTRSTDENHSNLVGFWQQQKHFIWFEVKWVGIYFSGIFIWNFFFGGPKRLGRLKLFINRFSCVI